MKRSDASKERIQKVLARAGLGSRRSVEELVRQRLVTVNGQIAELGEKVDVEKDSIKVEGRRLRQPKRQRYLLLNKPAGVLTTLNDPERRTTVIDLVPRNQQAGLFPVGRLDFHTEGLILLTSDGDFADRVMHPRHGRSKVYLAKVRGEPTEEQIERLRRGIRLEGRKTAPCEIEPKRMSGGRKASANTWWQVTLREGRTRQIREMFQRVGHPVQRLRRVAIGGLRDRSLASGQCRELSAEEVELLLSEQRPRPTKSAAGQGPARGAARKKAATQGAARKPIAKKKAKPAQSDGRKGSKAPRGRSRQDSAKRGSGRKAGPRSSQRGSKGPPAGRRSR